MLVTVLPDSVRELPRPGEMPPPLNAVLPVTVVAVNVKELLLPVRIPPPLVALPPLTVSPEITTVRDPPTLKTRDEELPLTASSVAPGPLIVRFLSIRISPVVSVITLHPNGEAKAIVSPEAASTTAWRSVPGPESSQLVTVTDAATARPAVATTVTHPPSERAVNQAMRGP